MYYYSFLQLLLMLLSSLPAVSFCMLALRSKLCFPFPVTALALVAYYSVYLAVSACTATFAPSLGNLVLPLFSVLFFILHAQLVRVNLWKILFLHLTGINFLSAAYLWTIPTDIRYSVSGGGAWLSWQGSLLFTLYALAIITLVYLLFFRNMEWIIDYLENLSLWKFICIIPAIFTAINLFMIPFHYETLEAGRVYPMFRFLQLILLFPNFISYLMFFKITKGVQENEQLKDENRTLALQASQYETLQTRIRESTHLRHDFRHQLLAISGLVNAGNYEELKAYLQTYTETLPDTAAIFCANPAIDALARYYQEYAASSGVPVQWRLNLSHHLPIPEPDLVLLIGNLLENGIDGARLVPAKKRCLSISASMISESTIILQVKNSFNGKLDIRDGKLYSTKHPGMGIGLLSVEATVKKYGGSLYLEHDSENFTVKLRLNAVYPS